MIKIQILMNHKNINKNLFLIIQDKKIQALMNKLKN